MFKKLLNRLPNIKRLPSELGYDEARDVLERDNFARRSELAGREDAAPEMLYHLATDASEKIRRKVAANPTMPIQAGDLLCEDQDDEVRCELARNIARLLPGLQEDAQAKICAQAVATLEKLAADHLPRVREIVAEEIKHSTDVPKQLVLQLSTDAEQAVRAPVLEYSPLLSDDDLLEILASGIVDGAMEPIAGRSSVSEPIADAIVAALDVSAVAALLANKNAQIREETLDTIIDQAEDIQDWHRPIVMRPELSLRAVRRVAGFVASSLLTVLVEREDLELDEKTVTVLRKNIRRRIETEESLSLPASQEAPGISAQEAFQAGQLDEAAITAAVDGRRREFVIEALALMSGISETLSKRVIESRSGKAITALTWKSGLSMRTALAIQKDIGYVPAVDVTLARNGIDYPMTEEEMRWHLQFFQIEA